MCYLCAYVRECVNINKKATCFVLSNKPMRTGSYFILVISIRFNLGRNIYMCACARGGIVLTGYCYIYCTHLSISLVQICINKQVYIDHRVCSMQTNWHSYNTIFGHIFHHNKENRTQFDYRTTRVRMSIATHKFCGVHWID